LTKYLPMFNKQKTLFTCRFDLQMTQKISVTCVIHWGRIRPQFQLSLYQSINGTYFITQVYCKGVLIRRVSHLTTNGNFLAGFFFFTLSIFDLNAQGVVLNDPIKKIHIYVKIHTMVAEDLTS